MGSYRFVLVSFLVLAALSSDGGVNAQVQTVDFVVPSDTPVASGTGEDMLVITGRPLGTAEAGDCGSASSHPVQNAVHIHPAKDQPRLLTLIITDRTDPVRPGTKLANVHAIGTCEISTAQYTKYRGEVQ